MIRLSAVLGLLAACAGVLPGQSIQYDEAKKVWLLNTRTSSYALGVASDGALRNLYWGAPLWRMEDLAAPAQQRELSSFDPGPNTRGGAARATWNLP